jgi:hypothetical protein
MVAASPPDVRKGSAFPRASNNALRATPRGVAPTYQNQSCGKAEGLPHIGRQSRFSHTDFQPIQALSDWNNPHSNLGWLASSPAA